MISEVTEARRVEGVAALQHVRAVVDRRHADRARARRARRRRRRRRWRGLLGLGGGDDLFGGDLFGGDLFGGASLPVVFQQLGALYRVNRSIFERNACRSLTHKYNRGRIPLPVDPRRDDARIFLDEALVVVRVRLSVQILFIVPVDVFALRGRGRRRRGAVR